MILIALAFVFSLGMSAPKASGGNFDDKQVKLALDEMKNEIVILQRQLRDMQESLDRNSGQINALINQIIDNVSAIRQAQGRVSEGSLSAIKEVNGVGERLSATNQRIDRLSEQIAELKKLVEDMPKLPAFTQITPGNPDQLFAAAYADYSRGNYDLAISEFRQYVETYPTSEMADNAQYWIGEALFGKHQYEQAIAEFDKVSTLFPKGDKIPGARFKKAMALQELGDSESARAEFQAVIKLFPRSNEAALARQQLGQ